MLNSAVLKEKILGTKINLKLQKEILDNLKKVEMTYKSVDTETGKTKDETIKPFDSSDPKMVKNISKVIPGNLNEYTGIEAIIEIIVDRVVSSVVDEIITHIKNNLEVSIPIGSFVNVVTGQAAGVLNIVPVTIKSPYIQ
jgi:hypothetical protein